MHEVAILLTKRFISKQWIDAKDQNWCVYVIETKLLASFFSCVIIALAIILNALPQTIIFTLVFYHLRRRIGGYHAPNAWICQIASIGIVFCVALLIGPALEQVPLLVIILANLIVLIFALIRQPVYPPQTQFDDIVVIANNRKKNIMLLLIATIQLVCGYFYPDVVVYSFLGVLTGLVSVYIELLRQRKKEDYNEKVGVSR